MKDNEVDYKEVEEILEKFDSKIKQSLKNTNYQDREDLEQEIKLKIIEKLFTVEFKEPPCFWCFFKPI
ncbi:helix-turn-helix domain-containing protein [Virgibacillus kimchii]